MRAKKKQFGSRRSQVDVDVDEVLADYGVS